jgi:hypothetical protein
MTTERRAATNSTLAIGGVSSPLDSLVVTESSVLRTNFCSEKPAHRQSAKRYGQFAGRVFLQNFGDDKLIDG